jgi:hypothetical protein
MTLLELEQEINEGACSVVNIDKCARLSALTCVLFVRLRDLQHEVVAKNAIKQGDLVKITPLTWLMYAKENGLASWNNRPRKVIGFNVTSDRGHCVNLEGDEINGSVCTICNVKTVDVEKVEG